MFGRKKVKRTSLKEIADSEDIGAFRIDRDGAVKLMANEILGVPTHIKVGHKNGNVYDNRRCNLYIIDEERNNDRENRQSSR